MNCPYCRLGLLQQIVYPMNRCLDRYGRALPIRVSRCDRCMMHAEAHYRDEPCPTVLQKEQKPLEIPLPIFEVSDPVQLSLFDTTDFIGVGAMTDYEM